MKRKLLYVSKSIFLMLLLFAALPAFSAKIYFKNTLGWTNVYVYTYSEGYWNDNGSGANTPSCYGCTQMTKVETGSDIYECDVDQTFTIVSFTKDNQSTYNNFYQTDACYIDGYSTDKPMFTPDNTQYTTTNQTKYYNGTWSAYTTGTTYTPVLEKADEISCFYEVKSNDYSYIYAWTESTKYAGDWPGTPMTKVGTTADGKAIYKWTYSGSTAPAKVVFSVGSDSGKTGDLDFKNHGYYVDGTWTKEITDVAGSVTPTTTYYLVGDNFGDWSTDKGKPFVDGEVTVNFDNTYTASQFKILTSDGTWYGSANTVTSTSNNITLSTSEKDNAKIDINLTGSYTFKMTENSDGTIKLDVTYPASSTALPTNLKFQSGAENNWASQTMTSSEGNTKWTYTLNMSNNNAGEVWFRFVDENNKNSCVLAESDGVLIPVDNAPHNVAYLRSNSTTNNFKFYTTGAQKYTIVAQQVENTNWSVTITPSTDKKTEYVLDCNGASYSPMQSSNIYTFTLPKSAFTSSGLSFSIAKKGTSTTYLSASNNTFNGHVNEQISDITDTDIEKKTFSYTTSGTNLPSGDITVKYDASGKTLTLNYESQQSVISGSYYVVFPDANVGNTARADKTVTNIPPDHTAFRLIPSRNRNDDTLDEDLVSINLKIDGDKGRQLRYDTNGELKFYITDGSGNYFKKSEAVTGGKDYLHAFANGTNLGGQIANNGVDYYNTRSGSVTSGQPDYYYTIHKNDAAETKSLTFMFSKENTSEKEYIFKSGESAQKLNPAKPSNSVDGFDSGIKSGNLIVGFLTSRGHGSTYFTNHISKGVYLVGQMDGTSYTHNKKYPMKQILYPLGTSDEAKADSIVYSCTVKKGSADWDEFFLSFSTGDMVEGSSLWNPLLRPSVQNQMDGQALEGGVTFFKDDDKVDNTQQALNPLLSDAQKNRYVSYTIYFNATYSTYRIEFHDGFYIAGPAVDESRSYAPENRIAMSSAELNGKQHYIYTGKFKQGEQFAFFLNEDSYTLNYCEDNNAVSSTTATDAWNVQAPDGGADYAFYNHVQYNESGDNTTPSLGTGKNGMIWGLPTGTYTIRFYNHAEKENGQLYTVDKEVTMANVTSTFKESASATSATVHNYGGWRTLSDDCALLLPNGIKAYYAANVGNGKVYLKELKDGYIPAHCPVILSNPNLLAGNKSIAFPVYPDGYNVRQTLAEGEQNYLVDCYEKEGKVDPEVTENGTKKYNYFFSYRFKFAGKEMSDVPLGFWKPFAGTKTKKNYSYLSVDKQLNPSEYDENTYTFDYNETKPVASSKAYCFVMAFDEDELGDNTTTGIEQVKENVEVDMTNAVWHNMQGVRITKPSAPGMYICNGKKVVVR